MKTSRIADLTLAGILVVLAGVIVWETRRWPPATGFAGDPLILPRALAGLMCLAAAMLAYPALTAIRPAQAKVVTAESASDLKRAVLGVGSAIVFAAAMQPLGLIMAAVPFLLVLQWLAGASWQKALPASIIAPALIWLIFAVGLNVPLPAGILAPVLGR